MYSVAGIEHVIQPLFTFLVQFLTPYLFSAPCFSLAGMNACSGVLDTCPPSLTLLPQRPVLSVADHTSVVSALFNNRFRIQSMVDSAVRPTNHHHI